ncbi:uncharacterized protein BDV17DRAFT_281485 [Aspergillus undulatus]|uniref:uncharacterized protein n=1 Tax=Aspergillus undulatus TaxID=1810928 RepID=UPI003CCC90B6
MLGIPTGRGYDACRKQKKRCARREINCIGLVKEIVRFKSPPSNPLTVLTKAFIAAMAPETDLRYNLKWAYSGYLGMVPARLGANEALNTAVDALVTTHRDFACHREVTVKSLTKYSQALGALRRCLDDPLQAGTSETLCAVTLLLIVQSIQNPLEHKRTGHAEGAARIFKARKRRGMPLSRCFFSLCVLFEGLFNPHISLTPQEWKDLVESNLESDMSEGKMLHCLSRIPNILHRARKELIGLYTTTRAICDEFRARLLELEAPGALHAAAALNPRPRSPVMLHAHYQRTYGFAIIITLYINYTLVNMYMDENDVPRTCNLDAVYLAQKILGIAENAVVYRPFGAALGNGVSELEEVFSMLRPLEMKNS